MIPSKGRRNTSRRSSILKPPKARPALQNVDLNSSSSESSPVATKQKRRVSFAEKKHVKEFCDSLVQGTLWDNTYEENDVSNSKLPNTSIGDEKALESGTLQNIAGASVNSTNLGENCTAALNKTNDIGSINMDVVNPLVSLTSTESLLDIMSQKYNEKQDTRSLNVETEITKLKPSTRGTICYDDNSITFGAQNKENVNCLQFSKICSDEDLMEMTGVSRFLESPVQGNVNSDEKNIARNLFNNKDNTKPNLITDRNTLRKTDTCQDMSMEMTGVVGMYAQTHQERLTSNFFSNETHYFQDNSMDITGGLEDMEIIDTEPITSSKQQAEECKNITQTCDKEPEYNLQEHRDVRNMSMEFTTVVSHSNKPLVPYKDCIPQSRENDTTESDKSQIFHNVSMEMTEAIHIRDKENIRALNRPEPEDLGNVSMEFTTAIRSIPYDIEEDIVKYTDVHIANEVTSDLHKQQSKESIEIQHHEPDNRTMLIQVPMEITEAVPIYPLKKNTYSQESQVEHREGRKTESHTETKSNGRHSLKNAFVSNDLTQEVCLDRRKGLEGTNVIHENETKIFYNESLAFTEIVPTRCSALPATSQLSASKQTNYGKFSSNRIAVYEHRAESTKIFNNEKVSFTEAVPSSFIPLAKVDDVQLRRKSTAVYGNDEQHTLKEREDFHSEGHNFMSNKTIVQDLSMEITKAVTSLPTSYLDEKSAKLGKRQDTLIEHEDLQSKGHNFMSNKTIVQDLSMEITKTVTSLPTSDLDEKSAKLGKRQDTLIEHEDLQSKGHNKINKTIVQDLSMEITKTVTSLPTSDLDEKSAKLGKRQGTLKEREDFHSEGHNFMSNKTIVQDLSMEITKAVTSLPTSDLDKKSAKFGKRQDTLREHEDFHSKGHNKINKTIVQDLSMEITKAVTSLPNFDLDEKSAKFDTLSAEVSIHNDQSYKATTTQEKSGKTSGKTQDTNDVILKEKISATFTETLLPATNICTSSNLVNEQLDTQSPIKSDTECISREDNCRQSKYNDMSCEMACDKESYSSSVTFSARHKNLSAEASTSHKRTQSLSQQRNATNYCNESTMISETNNLTSEQETRKSENFQSDDASSSESAELKLMKTFISDDIEELETIQPPSFVCSDNSMENSLVNALHDSENNISEYEEDRIETHENSKKMSLMVQECYKKLCEKSSLIDIEKQLDSQYVTDMDIDDLNRACEDVITNVGANVTRIKEVENFDISSINADEKLSSNLKDNQKEVSFTTNLSDVMDEERISSPDIANERDICVDTNYTREDSMFIQDPFRSLIKKIKNQTRRDDCIWDLYYTNIEKKMLGISFISNSLLIVIYLADNDGDIATQVIKEVKIISRLAEDADNVLISVVHKILVEKLNAIKLTELFGNCQEVLPMLEHISQEVKLTMDFMFDLKRLDDLCNMEISRDRISFVSHTNKMDIVVIVNMSVKPFSDIKPDDITVSCLLGHVKDDDVKKLITNIKRDSKFLRRYMNDVRDYIELIEESIV